MTINNKNVEFVICINIMWHLFYPKTFQVEFAFCLPDEKFREKYGISKPTKTSTFITSCKVGGRATKMRDKLNEMGYNMVKAYTGSMTEWVKKGGEVEK